MNEQLGILNGREKGDRLVSRDTRKWQTFHALRAFLARGAISRDRKIEIGENAGF